MTVTTIGSPSRRIAAEVRAEAARQGVSMREVSRRLGVSQPWVSRRVSIAADVDLTFEDAAKLADALGVPVERLIANSGWLPMMELASHTNRYPLAGLPEAA